MITSASVGRHIKAARIAKGLLQSEVGRMLTKGRSHVAIADIESGKTRITIELLAEVASILDKPLTWFREEYPLCPTCQRPLS